MSTSNNLSRRSRVGWLPILVGFMFFFGCATVQPDDALSSVSPEPWVLVPSDDPQVVVVQQQLLNGLISMKCEQEICQVLIIVNAPCEMSVRFPVLINTEVTTSLTEAECLQEEDPPSDTEVDGIILLPESNLLLSNIVLNDDTTFAIPLADGSIAVIFVSMDGLQTLLGPLIPDLFQAPPWLNEHGIDPLPGEDNMDESEIIRWRRGLISI